MDRLDGGSGSDGGASDGDGRKPERRLRIISNRDAELVAMSPAEKFFEERIGPLLSTIAREKEKDGGSNVSYSLVPDELISEVVALLEKRAVCKGTIKSKRVLRRMIAVRVAPSYEGWYAVITLATDPFPDDFFPTVSYFFPVQNFIDESMVGYFASDTWIKIVEGIKAEHGETSEQFQDIFRVVSLVRSLLYREDDSHSERLKMAKELRTLRIKVGKAAAGVIADFISYYDGDDGVLDGGDIGEEDDDYPDFRIGDVDLRKLR